MIKLFRKIRQKLLSENRLSKYLLYAIGEIVLVVIGILIALQINNWNQNKLQQSALNDYLHSISKNIKGDLENVAFLRTNRTNTISRIPHMNWLLFESDYFEKPDVIFASETLSAISDFRYLNANLSGFESIKNSGYLSKLQGKDIENLIYTYYSLIQEIVTNEKDYNEFLRNSYTDFSNERKENMIFITYPDVIHDRDQLTKLQQYLYEILNHPSARSLYDHTLHKGPSLIVKYENLKIIGSEIVRMIENDLKNFDATSTKNLENIFNESGTIGYSKPLTNGIINNRFFDGGWASAADKEFENSSGINEMIINVPEIEWAVIYLRNPSNALVEKPTKDFSEYRALKLELKGHKGGELVSIALKDNEDPDDGSETRVPLTLSSEWETYEILLSEFKTANLKELFIVASFVFSGEARKISVRSIEYVK